MLTGIVLVVVGIVVCGLVLPRSLAGRTIRACLGAVGLKVRRFEEANALGLYDRALEQQGAALKQGVAGIGEFRAVVEGLGRQVRNAGENVRRLEVKLDAMDAQAVSDSDPAKLHVAGQLAAWKKRAADLEARLAEKQAVGERGMTGLKLAGAKLREGKQEREFLAADLEAAAADATVTDILAGLGEGLDGAASDAREARERLERQIDRHRANSAVLAEVAGVSDTLEAERLMAEAAGADLLAARRGTKTIANPKGTHDGP